MYCLFLSTEGITTEIVKLYNLFVSFLLDDEEQKWWRGSRQDLQMSPSKRNLDRKDTT
jgi:hypothetical protein